MERDVRARLGVVLIWGTIPFLTGQGCPLSRPDARPLVDDPIPAFVNDLIAKFAGSPLANPPARILRYSYNGQVVYYVPPECCDIPSQLFDSNGNVICQPDGGFTDHGDGRCPDFFDTRTDETLIWKDTRG